MSEPSDQRDTGPDEAPGLARWQKVAGIIGVVILLALGVLVVAGGDHGPGRHLPGSEAPPADEGG